MEEIIEQATDRASAEGTGAEQQPPAWPGGTQRQSLLDTLVSSLDGTLPAYSDEIGTDSEANRHAVRANRQSEESERSDAGILFIT